MNNCDPKFPCCPPETANVVQVQTVAGIKGLNNCFVYVQSINTSFYVDNAHRITWISSGVVEEEKYNLQTNPLNLRNQFLYDPSTKEVHYFSNKGYDATFASTVSQADLEALEQKIVANTQAIATNASNIATLTTTVETQGQEISQNKTAIQTNQETTTELQNDLENEISERINSDGELQTGITTINSNLNQEIEQSTTFATDNSTVTVEHNKVNLYNSTTSSASEALPVASATQAGVMNSATYEAVQSNAENIDAILNGAIALENISATPTQESLTAAWKEATGKETLVNRASIYDIDNDKVWYYYENIDEWKPLNVSAEGEINISTFTNDTAGIIQGSEEDGQVFAEPNGKGSVVGWDSLKARVATLEENPSSSVTIYNEYSTDESGVNSANFINDKLNSNGVILGGGDHTPENGILSNGVVIGNNAKANNSSVSIGSSSKAYLNGVAVGANANAPNNFGTAIGNSSKALQSYNSAFGTSSVASGVYCTAVGAMSKASQYCSIALGFDSITSREGEVSIGNGQPDEFLATRYIANVTAGELDTDAVNVAQLNAMNSNIQETLDDILDELNALRQRVSALE